MNWASESPVDLMEQFDGAGRRIATWREPRWVLPWRIFDWAAHPSCRYLWEEDPDESR